MNKNFSINKKEIPWVVVKIGNIDLLGSSMLKSCTSSLGLGVEDLSLL